MFNFFRKLFKALNSSGKSWQISLAIVLAMFAGFLPSNALILLDILFIALILNVNFGLFLLFSVIFAGVGYIFDPLFESIGYSVLTNEGLNGFFTALYNSVIFRWSAFNYTLITGSLVVSSILAIPMLVILNKLVSTYRDQIGMKLNEWKFTKWMNLFNDEAKTTGLFRWWGLGVFGGLFAFIVLVLVFLFDPLARIALEKSLSYTLQTEVNVRNFNSSFTDLSVEINGIEVADKDRLTHNLVQVKNLRFELGFSALVEKKAMIEHLDINALAFNELRKTPASAYSNTSAKEVAQDKENSEAKVSKSKTVSAFELPNVDDILAKEELKSITEAQKLKKDIEKTKEKWAKISKKLKSANEVDEIKADAKKLQESLKSANIQKLASAKGDIDKLKAKVTNLKSKYSNLQKDFNADQARIKKQIYALKSLPQEDVNRLKKKYSLNANGGANIIGTLVDEKVGSYIKKGLKYYEMLKPYLNDESEQVPDTLKPPRGEGRWISYANHSNIPSFVIKKAKVNVQLKADVLDVEISDFSSNQKLYGKPMTLHADAKGEQYKRILADVVDDRREETPLTTIDVKATEFKTQEYAMQTLSMNDIITNADFKGEIRDRSIKAKSKINVKQVKLQMPSQKLVNDLLAGISKFNVNIDVNGNLESPKIKVNSDLDKQLSSGMKSMVSKASKDFEKELTDGVMKKVSGSSDGLSSNLGDTGSLLNSKQDALGSINTNFSAKSGGSDLMKKFF